MDSAPLSPLAQRILMRLQQTGKTRAGLARACGVKPPSVSDWLNGRTKRLEGAHLLRAAAFLEVNPEWLATGSGPMQPAAPPPPPSQPGPLYVPIARVQLRVEAGITGFHVQQLDGDGPPIFFRRDFIEGRGWRADRLYALKVSGDSMEPSLFEGDLVVINTADVQPVDGQVFAVNYEGQLVIKRLRRDAGQWWLDSDNPRYKPKR
ncbi:MAG: helix-turn-helix domain-containing protein, partial [Rhodocyclaceae bacterium]|nr:helix-turn-helix domain-containing protein [Rhodocyclaceae bacterium]